MRCEPSKRWSFYVQIKDQFFSRSDFVSYVFPLEIIIVLDKTAIVYILRK